MKPGGLLRILWTLSGIRLSLSLEHHFVSDGGKNMQVREHPLMSRHGVPNWPPVWTWINGEDYKKPAIGEVGVLHGVLPSVLSDTCHIIMRHERCEYMGPCCSMTLSSASSCRGYYRTIAAKLSN